MHDKAAIRAHILQARKNRSSDVYVEKSRLISERLLVFCRDQSFDVVHTFLPMTAKGEPDISTFITTSLNDGLSLMVPEVVRGQLEMQHHWYRFETELHDGQWGVSVPKISDVADPKMADAVLVPMLAVDAKGYRVGYGKGYYDYFLSGLDAVFVGVCFDEEVVDHMPHESHDVPIHYIISDMRSKKIG